MWDLHHEVLTLLTESGDIDLHGYNVQIQTDGRGSTPVGAEGITAVRARASGPLTDAVEEGMSLVHRGRVYEVDGPPQHFTGGVLDHTELWLVERFPARWLVTVTVVRSGGRDARGNPLPAERIPVKDCLVRWRSSTDPLDRTDLTDSSAVLYRRRGFDFRSTDQIEVPAGSLAAGTWSVDGDPKRWPDSVELALTKTGGA